MTNYQERAFELIGKECCKEGKKALKRLEMYQEKVKKERQQRQSRLTMLF